MSNHEIHESHQSSRVSDAENQHTGGIGVESSGVTDLSFSEPLPQSIDHVVARTTGRLVDDDETVYLGGLAPGHGGQFSSGPSSSLTSSRTSSLTSS